MKQAVLALASLMGATLGVSEAQATAMATDVLAGNAPNNISVRQQKAIFAFSQERASMTMDLIDRWSDAGAAERDALARTYLDAFFAALDRRKDSGALASDIAPSLLLADALGNAKALLTDRPGADRDTVSATVEAVKAGLMRVAYETRNELIAPYIPQQLAWGQHGQHFPRSQYSSQRRPPPKKQNRR